MQNISKDSYSAPALRGKEDDIEGKTISLSMKALNDRLI